MGWTEEDGIALLKPTSSNMYSMLAHLASNSNKKGVGRELDPCFSWSNILERIHTQLVSMRC